MTLKSKLLAAGALHLTAPHPENKCELRPLLAAMAEVCEAADELMVHYVEQKDEVEAPRLRTIHLSSEKMMNVYDRLEALRKLCEGEK